MWTFMTKQSASGGYSNLLLGEAPHKLDTNFEVEDEADAHIALMDIALRYCRRKHILILCISIAVNIILCGTLIWQGVNATPRYDGLYSPASVALERQDVVFRSSFGNQVTPYQGHPDSSNDALWKTLYSHGVSRISTTEARPFVNKTLPIPGDPGHYITSLSVFHQLHCLNMVRKGLYGDVDWTNQDERMGIEHLDHCIDIIRQNLQCTADITPLTFVRDPQDGRAKEVAQVIHTCRNFEKIREWALDHRMLIEFDPTVVVRGDDLGWGDYTIDFPL